MISSASLMGVPGAGLPLRVLGPDFAGRVAVARAGAALAQDAAGAWQPAAANTPRFTGPARRLMVEAARGNGIRNPRAEGAVIGAPGTLPTNWQVFNLPGGITYEVAGTGSESGIPFLDLRIAGTPTGTTTSAGLAPETTTAIAAATGQVWTASAYFRLVAGSMGNLGWQPGFQSRTAGGGGGAEYRGSYTPTAAPLAGQRHVLTTTTTGTTLSVWPVVRWAFTTGQAVDVTIRIGAPQLELGEVATSPILPPVGAPAAGTRAADQPLWTPAGGLGGAGTLVIGAMLPNLAVFGTHQGLAQIDDGTDLNRLAVRNTSGGSTVFGIVDSGGTTLATLPGGSMTPGVPFRAALAWAPGEVAFCLAGGAVQGAALTLPAGLARLLVGHASTALNRAANGEVALLDYRPQRLPDAMLQAATAAA